MASDVKRSGSNTSFGSGAASTPNSSKQSATSASRSLRRMPMSSRWPSFSYSQALLNRARIGVPQSSHHPVGSSLARSGDLNLNQSNKGAGTKEASARN